MSIKDKPAENAALVAGVVTGVADLFNVKVPAGIMGDIITAAPFVVAVVPHAITAGVDTLRGRKAAAAVEAAKAKAAAEAEFEHAVTVAVNKRLAARPAPIVAPAATITMPTTGASVSIPTVPTPESAVVPDAPAAAA